MKEEKQRNEDFVGYEEARKDKGHDKSPEPVSDKEVETANKIINPDCNSMDSRG